MSQITNPPETKATAMVRVFLKDQERMDALAADLEKDRGGSWSRAHVTELAIEALGRERAANAQAET